ncbi:MAG TPA: transglutaminase-like domain-containing protein, partial [Nitrospiria bacterium]|nr:transglutaminase-like domain-containing protein [Nitrospiria bacterium]
NVQNYYDPENSYINQVLERRTGIPITLATVYLLIAQRVGLPLSGVGLPGHFMLKYEQGKTCIFIDAFNSGRALTRDDCIRFLLNSGYEVQEECFLETTPRDIICRMLRNLIYAYHRIGDRDRACRLTRLIHILQLSPQE